MYFLDAVLNPHGRSEGARIVSLVPSITETLFSLSLGRHVVGRTRFCTEPATGVAQVADVGGTKSVDVDRVFALRPTHVIVNVDETPRAVADAVRAAGIDVIVTHPVAVADNPPLFRLLGGIFGRNEEAERLCDAFDAAHRALIDVARGWPCRRILYLIWRKPWMTISTDTYVADLLATAKLIAVHPPGDRYPTVEINDALLAAVDLVLLATEPFPFSDADVAAFVGAFPAAAGKTRLIDGTMISWYGSRAAKALVYLQQFATPATLGIPGERHRD